MEYVQIWMGKAAMAQPPKFVPDPRHGHDQRIASEIGFNQDWENWKEDAMEDFLSLTQTCKQLCKERPR